jgi:hypothetical protein
MDHKLEASLGYTVTSCLKIELEKGVLDFTQWYRVFAQHVGGPGTEKKSHTPVTHFNCPTFQNSTTFQVCSKF